MSNKNTLREEDEIKNVKFPKNAPSRVDIAKVTQIDYHFARTPQPDLVQVKASNNLHGAGTYLWRFVPQHYTPILGIVFLRLELLKRAATDHPDSGGDAKHIKCAQRYLINLDSVLDALWEHARVDHEEDKMDSTWHDKTFERWLCIENMVGRHSPEAVERWIALDPQNEAALSSRFNTLGTSSIYICISMQ